MDLCDRGVCIYDNNISKRVLRDLDDLDGLDNLDDLDVLSIYIMYYKLGLGYIHTYIERGRD